VCRWHATYHWKTLDKGYNFYLNFTSIKKIHKKLWAFKTLGLPISGISELPSWSPETKWHLDVGPMAKHRYYYKGGRWWLPPNPGCDKSYEFMFTCALSMHQKCFNYALTNLLFGLCRSMWIIYSLFTHPSPYPGAPTCPSTPEMLRAKERTPAPYPFVAFTFGLAVEFIKKFGGASMVEQRHISLFLA